MPLRTGRNAWVLPEHRRVASGPRRFRGDEVGQPPGAQLTEQKQAVADPQIVQQPGGPWPGRVDQTDVQPAGVGRGADEGDGDEPGARIRRLDRPHIVEPAHWQPVMAEEKGHLEDLQGNQFDVHGLTLRSNQNGCHGSSSRSTYAGGMAGHPADIARGRHGGGRRSAAGGDRGLGAVTSFSPAVSW